MQKKLISLLAVCIVFFSAIPVSSAETIYSDVPENSWAAEVISTKGVGDDTADDFSDEKINSIIKSLTDETYTQKPVCRDYIPVQDGFAKICIV